MTKIAGIAVLACIATAIVSGVENDRPSFESNILPIFQAKCLACHSGASPQAGLDLATRDSAMRGGKSGPAIKQGSSEGSLLVEKIVSKAMPPAQPKLTDKEIAQRLVISSFTVHAHTRHIFRKLRVNNRQAAVTAARAMGILA